MDLKILYYIEKKLSKYIGNPLSVTSANDKNQVDEL